MADYGIIGALLDSLNYGASIEPFALQVSPGVIAVWSRTGNAGYVRTFGVATDGTISAIDSWGFASIFIGGRVVHVSGSVYALTFRGNDNNLQVLTMSIAEDGTIIKTVIELHYTGVIWTSILPKDVVKKPGTTVYVMFHQDTSAFTEDHMFTMNIDDDGTNISTLNVYPEPQVHYSPWPSLSYISGDVFALLNEGTIQTFAVSDAGVKGSILDTEILSATGSNGHIENVSGGMYIVVYDDADTHTYVATLTIDSAGIISTPVGSDQLSSSGTNLYPHIMSYGLYSGVYYFIVDWNQNTISGRVRTVKSSDAGVLELLAETEFMADDILPHDSFHVARNGVIAKLAFPTGTSNEIIATFEIGTAPEISGVKNQVIIIP